jgi:hypothetical protein
MVVSAGPCEAEVAKVALALPYVEGAEVEMVTSEALCELVEEVEALCELVGEVEALCELVGEVEALCELVGEVKALCELVEEMKAALGLPYAEVAAERLVSAVLCEEEAMLVLEEKLDLWQVEVVNLLDDL